MNHTLLSVQNYIYPCSDGHLLMLLLKSTIPLVSIFRRQPQNMGFHLKKTSHPLWH